MRSKLALILSSATLAITSASLPVPCAARSAHGLDDSDTTGSHGYDVHSRGEAFTKDSWPESTVWQKLWDVCDDKHCDGSFQIRNEWPVCQPPIPPATTGTCSPTGGIVTVTVKGDYSGQNGWDVRDALMKDLFEHYPGDGGVYHNGDAGWGNGFGYPPGWWVPSNTWIRHSGTGFWVNIEIKESPL